MKKFSIGRNMQCLCGSGEKYKNCCLAVLSNISVGMDIQKEIDQNNFETALKYARADLTQYIEGVKRDTELLLVANPALGKSMLEIDLKALETIIEKTMFVIKQGELDIDFIYILNNLKKVFYNPDWHELLTYYKVVWLYFHQENIEAAEAVLSEVSYKEISHIGFLQLFLDLKNKDLSFSNKIEILDKIKQGVKTIPEKIQYIGAKGVEYLLIGDLDRSQQIFTEAVLIAEKNINKFKETYDYFQLANLYYTAGSICENKSYVEKAVDYYLRIPKDKNVTPMGISDAFARLGKVYINLGDQAKALAYFNKSIEIDDNPLSSIFVAEAYIMSEEFDKALDTLSNIDSDKLQDAEKMDFIFAYAQLILLTNNKDKVEDILTKLKELKVSSKYYSDIKNSLIIDLHEVFYSPASQANEVKETKVKGLIRKLNDYVQLQPNWNGVGININR